MKYRLVNVVVRSCLRKGICSGRFCRCSKGTASIRTKMRSMPRWPISDADGAAPLIADERSADGAAIDSLRKSMR